MDFLEYLLPRLFPNCECKRFVCDGASAIGYVTYPDIKPLLDQDKRQGPLLVRQANPHLAVHQQAMVQVYHPLLEALGPGIDPGVLFSLFPCQPVQAKEVSVLCLYYMFFGRVAKRGAEVDEVGGISDRGGDG